MVRSTSAGLGIASEPPALGTALLASGWGAVTPAGRGFGTDPAATSATAVLDEPDAPGAPGAASAVPGFPGVPPAISGAWFVLHTRVHQEKAVAATLEAMDIGYFLPLLRHARYYGRRKATVDLPMFPSYVFLRGSVDQAYAIDRTKRVARILPVADQAQLDWELRNLRLALQQQAPLDPYPYLKTGLRAEVRAGPFRGLQGVIESRTRCNRLILQVEMLGRAMSVEIDGGLLEAVE